MYACIYICIYNDFSIINIDYKYCIVYNENKYNM